MQPPYNYKIIGHTIRPYQKNSPGTTLSILDSKEQLVRLCKDRSLPLESIASKIDFSKRNLIVISRTTSHRSHFMGITAINKLNGIMSIEFGEMDMKSDTPRIAMPRPGYSSVFASIDKPSSQLRVNLNDKDVIKLEHIDQKAAKLRNRLSERYKKKDEYLAELCDLLEFKDLSILGKTLVPPSVSAANPEVNHLLLKYKKAMSAYESAKQKLEQHQNNVISRFSGALIPTDD